MPLAKMRAPAYTAVQPNTGNGNTMPANTTYPTMPGRYSLAGPPLNQQQPNWEFFTKNEKVRAPLVRRIGSTYLGGGTTIQTLEKCNARNV